MDKYSNFIKKINEAGGWESSDFAISNGDDMASRMENSYNSSGKPSVNDKTYTDKPKYGAKNTGHVKLTYSKKLLSILKEMESNNNLVAFELLWLIEPDTTYHNGLSINRVDTSKLKGSFHVFANGRKTYMPIVNFIKYYFKNYFKQEEIRDFLKEYNSLTIADLGTPIEVQEFKYDPLDIRRTFLSLVTKTYPHGHEEEVLQFLPSLKKDIVGNYYTIVGSENQETMFTSHLDTADREQKVTRLFATKEGEDDFIITDGNSILGSDDKTGVTVMLYMIENKVPGLYYFFIGEERGGIGSGLLSNVYDNVSYLKNIKRCVSFDRRDVCSVITEQMGRQCCSNTFGSALCKEYNKNGLNLSLDPTGIYTDSASFLDNIPECTNISVGYYSEHTGDERQNMTYLEKLCKASVKVNWNSLPTDRKVGIDEYILAKYNKFIKDIKGAAFTLDVKVKVDEYGVTCLMCDLGDGYIDEAYDTLTSVQILLNKHKVPQNVFFDGDFLKIELK